MNVIITTPKTDVGKVSQTFSVGRSDDHGVRWDMDQASRLFITVWVGPGDAFLVARKLGKLPEVILWVVR